MLSPASRLDIMIATWSSIPASTQALVTFGAATATLSSSP